MRHTFVSMSIDLDDSFKTIQGNVGHHTVAFMLEKYGHMFEGRRKESSERMNQHIAGLQADNDEQSKSTK